MGLSLWDMQFFNFMQTCLYRIQNPASGIRLPASSI